MLDLIEDLATAQDRSPQAKMVFTCLQHSVWARLLCLQYSSSSKLIFICMLNGNNFHTDF